MLAVVAALLLSSAPIVSPAHSGPAPEAHQYRIGIQQQKRAVATLTTHVVARTGKPVENTGHAINIRTGDGDFLSFDGDTAKTQLEPGTYDVSVLSVTTAADGATEIAAVTNRQVEVTAGGGETTVDARPARPVTAKVDRPGATVVDSSVTVAGIAADQGLVNTYFTGAKGRVFAVPNKPVPDRKQVFVYRPTLGGPGLRYHLVHVSESLPDAPVYYTPDRKLARFDTTYYAQGLAVKGTEGNNGQPAAVPGLSFFRFVDLDFPSARTEYYTADPSVTWLNFRALGGESAYTRTPFTPGRSRSTWFRPPVGVAWGSITRSGDQLNVNVQPFAPSDGKRYPNAFGAGDPGKTVLFKDGKEIGAAETVGTADLTLPQGPGTYTLRTSGTREVDYSNLNTTVVAEWTFTDVPKALISLGVNGLSRLGQVRTGSNHELTLAADPQAGTTVTPAGVPSLEVSYDDGKSWRRVSVGWGAQRGNAWLVEPDAKGFVSLRVSANFTDGSKFTETLIHAYELI
ncbi:hypothetical protein Lesp02_70000 [Lentzea sp. NBRC 105346]|uniref:hypothetical protein n=1 Tax=Lentzea sp. NBRC 105346 TaxID=3032205 RepID=UPI0024A0B4E2|nr:hypothetical protein [Lentzea sp. NBRC 105346]GLZ34813.1 hypothetical protein Lesp02_70000 [Lentzea sp. NBRC 105346]